MKKNKIIFYVTLTLLFFFFDNVKALYNGSGGNIYTGSGNYSCSSKNKYCTTGGQSNFIIIKAGIYYIDNGEFIDKKPIGGDYYFVNNTAYEALKKSGLKLKKISAFENCTNNNNRYECASNKLRIYFGDTKGNPAKNSEGEKFLNDATKKTGTEGYLKVLNKPSEWANKDTPATKGYRIILEPVRLFGNSLPSGGTVLLTPKELAGVAINFGTKDASSGRYSYNEWYIPSCTGTPGQKASGCNNPLLGKGSFSQVFFTEFTDVGIEKYRNGCENVSIEELANEKNGCGYNIIDISPYTDPPKCYDKKVKNTDGKLECKNTDQNNTANFEEIYEERTCTSEEAEISTTSKYGKKIKENDNCTLYCIESAFASFPGNVSGAVSIETISNRGTYFTWPSRIGTSGMTMLMRSKLVCRIVQKEDKTCTAENINNLTTAATDTIKSMKLEASLKAGTNNEIDEKLISYNISYDNKIDNIKLDNDGVSNSFSLEKEAYFKIQNNKNRLYNRESGNVFDGVSSTSNIIFDRGEGVISLKKEDDVSKIYDLEIKNVKIGSGTFDELITSYVCHYQLKIDDCVCPEGTLRKGESLYEELISGKSCTELQNTLCNICQCPPNSSNKYEIIKIGEDATTEVCQSLQKEQCYSNYCTYKGKKINLDECIKMQKEKNNLSEEEAIVYCDKTLCPKCIDKNGKEIDISACLETGNSYAICENLYCKKSVCIDNKCYECSENCSWKLVKKSKTSIEYQKSCSDGENCDYIKLSCPGGNDNMNNADNCIQNELANKLNGNSIAVGLNKGLITNNDVRRAFAACEKEVCPYSGSEIVYRQIDLNDPFPGKEHLGTNETLKLSNNSQSIKNRIPGENWNSQLVIKSKILNARGAKGYDLYNKDPLYIIKLTPDTIKKIREYNKKNSYDDFNLVCTNTSKSANCISNFLHKGIDNLNPRDFVLSSYGSKNSVSNCYNMSYSEASFNSCYNKDN